MVIKIKYTNITTIHCTNDIGLCNHYLPKGSNKYDQKISTSFKASEKKREEEELKEITYTFNITEKPAKDVSEEDGAILENRPSAKIYSVPTRG